MCLKAGAVPASRLEQKEPKCSRLTSVNREDHPNILWSCKAIKSRGFGSKNQFLWESCHNKAPFLAVQVKMNMLSADRGGSGFVLAGEACGKGSVSPTVILPCCGAVVQEFLKFIIQFQYKIIYGPFFFASKTNWEEPFLWFTRNHEV